MKIIVFGATGPTGREVLKQGLAQGLDITAVARNPQALADMKDEHLQVVQADVFDAASVEKALADNYSAVIATYGLPYTFKPVTIYSEGIKNILAGMKKQGTKRLIAVTSGGAVPYYDKKQGVIFGLIVKNTIGRTIYEDMRRMENTITNSGFDWTIVRPAALINTPTVTNYRVERGYTLKDGSKTSRADLADLLLKSATENLYVREGVAVAV